MHSFRIPRSNVRVNLPRAGVAAALVLALLAVATPAFAQSDRAARNAQAAHASADEKYRKRNYDGAIADWTRAMAAQPQEPSWIFNRGLARKGKKDFEGAVADFTKAIEIKPDDGRYYAERAFARYELGILSNALSDLDRAVSLEPDNADRHLNRATMKRYLGNYREATVDFDSALKLNPRLADAYFGRAAIRQAQGDASGALADYNQAIAVDGGQRYPYFFRFVLQKLRGQENFADLARAVAKWPDGWDRAIGLYLIDSLSEQDFLARAERGDAPTRRNQLSEAHYYVAMIALAARNPAKAERHFQLCVDQNVKTYLEDLIARAELARLARE